ncbi:MAG TPA: FG-GAP-like repeat-containing protein [Pyrinomonadaceae bacterium]|nr:FG-GAP-like repeat-containing protein [Pyrinomonadaceae bacterium]
MKKRLALFLALVAAFCFFAFFRQTAESSQLNTVKKQKEIFSELKPELVQASAFGVSVPASSLAPAQPEAGKTSRRLGRAEEQARAVENKLPFRKQVAGAPQDNESNLARTAVEQMPAPALSFNGISSSEVAAAFGFRIIPPDTNGDVGLNHYVQSVNALTRIFDKNGNPLTPPFKLSSLFSVLGTPCSMRDDGDPVVLYDALADRWFLSQFCNNFPPFRQMIAVSKTGDPTGGYYVYEFVMPNVKLNDYPKFGVWTDAIYMSTDEFLGGDYAGTGTFAFDKRKLYAGEPLPSYIYFDLASPTTIRFGGLLPSDFDGLNPPPAGAPNVFAGYTANEYGDAQDALRLFEFRPNFTNPSASTFAERAESPLAVAPFNPTSPEGRTDIQQPPPGEPLDSQSDRLMYRAAYRNFGTHDSLVLNQTVRVSPVGQTYRAGVRVYELRRNLLSAPPLPPFTVYEQASIGDMSASRWMGSAAQDYQGNIAVGYSYASEEKKPSITFSGKLAGEPNGVFRAERNLVEGTGVQTAFGFRWGDYSAMSIDPTDDCMFWYTNQYYTLESQEESPFGWLTRVGKFKFNECAAAPRATITGLVNTASGGIPIPNATVTASAYSRTTDQSGHYGNLLVLPGTYTVTASARGFRSQTVTVTVADGQTLIQNFSLQPTAVLENTGAQISAESCQPNNAVDPGETVTINIALRNTGAQNTTNLTATLLPTGGVTNPGAPQNYGALATGGQGASRPFTFTASAAINCGSPVTLTLQLQDGAENLGTVSIVLKTGVLRNALQENFDSVTEPNLPNGWATSATGAQQNWKTVTNRRQSPPNSVFSPAPNQVGVNELVSPVFPIASANAEVGFRNWYELETTFLRNKLYDGSVLEIKIGGANWQDIEAAGGAFLAGGYDGVLDSCCQNPLSGRRAWSGKSGPNQTPEFITSKAKLPASAQGQNVQLRWRIGTDLGTFREGQYIDDLLVTDGYVCNCVSSQTNRAPFDFDGDGKTDLSVFRPTDNGGEADFYVQQSASDSFTGAAWGSVGDAAANADYDGDGKTDYAVFRPSANTWFILQSGNGTFRTQNFGLAGDRLAPADYDGDGKSDVAVFRPSDGTWYISQSTNGQLRAAQFGTGGDLPAAADFDADGKADLAVFRPSGGIWFYLQSSDGSFRAAQFGTGGDKPVAGDYDGDNKADFVVFRPSNGTWYLLGTTQGFTAAQFGSSEDRPLQADFDGDGKRDIAVFRPSTGNWFYLRSSNGSFASAQFGLGTDAVVPSIFVNF